MTDQQVSFTAFVISLATTAAVHFGDVPDPVTGGTRANLDGAAQMIDILAMLQEKTRGNLTDAEAKVIDDVLYELRMRFVAAGRESRTAHGAGDPP